MMRYPHTLVCSCCREQTLLLSISSFKLSTSICLFLLSVPARYYNSGMMWEPTGVILEADLLPWWHSDLVTQRKLCGCRHLLLCQILSGCRVPAVPGFSSSGLERVKERCSLGWDGSRNRFKSAHLLWEVSFGNDCIGNESGVAKQPHTTKHPRYQDREWSDCWRFLYFTEDQVHLWWSLAISLSQKSQSLYISAVLYSFEMT